MTYFCQLCQQPIPEEQVVSSRKYTAVDVPLHTLIEQPHIMHPVSEQLSLFPPNANRES